MVLLLVTWILNNLPFVTGFMTFSTVHVVEVYIGDNPIYGYIPTVATTDVAFSQLEKLYPEILANYTRKIFRVPGMYSCPESGAIMTALTGDIMTTLDRLSGFKVIISSGIRV